RPRSSPHEEPAVFHVGMAGAEEVRRVLRCTQPAGRPIRDRLRPAHLQGVRGIPEERTRSREVEHTPRRRARVGDHGGVDGHVDGVDLTARRGPEELPVTWVRSSHDRCLLTDYAWILKRNLPDGLTVSKLPPLRFSPV